MEKKENEYRNVKLENISDEEGINVSLLFKGDWIGPKELSKLFKTTPTYSKYDDRFKVLKKQIQDTSESSKRPLICKQSAKGMAILTDEEAVYYKRNEHRSVVGRLRTIDHQLYLINGRNLSKFAKKTLKQEKTLQGKVLEAIESVMETERKTKN